MVLLAARLVLFVVLFLGLFTGLAWLAWAVGLRDGPPLVWTVLFGVPAALGASWFCMTRLEHASLAGLGLRSGRAGLRGVALGVAIGVGLIAAAVGPMVALGWIGWTASGEGAGGWATSGVLLGALLFGAAWMEELLFRGYPFQLLAGRLGPLVAIVGTSIAFGALHGGNPGVGPLALLNITLAGLLLAILFWKTRDLWLATGVHLGWNWAMALGDLSVSGLPMEVAGIDPVLHGPALWTGGPFGPEGGLAVTAVSGAAILWAASSRMLTPSLEVRAIWPPSEGWRRAPARGGRSERGDRQA